MADDIEMNDVDDDMPQDFHGIVGNESDSDEADDTEATSRLSDTSAAEARKGHDIQGIPWDRITVTRDKYRKTRLEQYQNYENVPESGKVSAYGCTPTKKGGKFYEFWCNTRSVRSTIRHFQLRNLVWASSKHDVYLMSHFSVIHWSALTREKTEVLDVSGHVTPSEKNPGSLLEGFFHTQVSTMAVKDNLLVAGGFQGEFICKYLDRPGINYCCRMTHDDNAITNSIEIYNSLSGAVHFMASNNDCGVRVFDMEKFEISKHLSFPWPVNHSSLSPDQKLVCVVGDNPEGLLVDANTGKAIEELSGHIDYSFASAWNPDGITFVTGNQDKTCRVWDIRNLSQPLAVLRGHLGAIRSVRFSSDGRFLAMAEPADFVHIFDAATGYQRCQEIDFFGEISGISFSPDTEALFVGVWDQTYGSLLQYSRYRRSSYLDALI